MEVGVREVRGDLNTGLISLGCQKGPDFSCDLSGCSDIAEFRYRIAVSINCPEEIPTLNSLFDKLVDLYWIDAEGYPIIVFDNYNSIRDKFDEGEFNSIASLMRDLDRFWNEEFLEGYSAHKGALYVLHQK